MDLCDTSYVYIAVKGSLYLPDSAVFGLNETEIKALCNRFQQIKKEIINGIQLKAAPIAVVNALSELGYKVICTTGETEVVWTMQREI